MIFTFDIAKLVINLHYGKKTRIKYQFKVEKVVLTVANIMNHPMKCFCLPVLAVVIFSGVTVTFFKLFFIQTTHNTTISSFNPDEHKDYHDEIYHHQHHESTRAFALSSLSSMKITSDVIIGRNLFLHAITSGTCASNRLESIQSYHLCTQAFQSYRGHSKQKPYFVGNQDHHETTCSASEHKPDLSNLGPRDTLWGKNNLCTFEEPCFCQSSHFIPYANNNNAGEAVVNEERNLLMNGQYQVTWDLNLGGNEFLLQSSKFLKAGFEQSVKDYINKDILCSDDSGIKGAEFMSVEIGNDQQNKNNKSERSVSGNGKCRGNVRKCKKPLKLSELDEAVITDDDDDVSATRSSFVQGNDVCETFRNSTIFDAFRQRLQTATFFNYDVDVDVLHDLEGNLKLNYDISFPSSPPDGLGQIKTVDGDPADPIPIAINDCNESQCMTQREVMRRIFSHLTLPWEDDKHECLYEGINCNAQDVVTHVWMGK